MRYRPFALVLISAVLGACGAADAGGRSNGGGRVRVVTTVSPITSIAANVIGDLADIRGVVPEGTNSHTFEPPPSVAEHLAEADVVFLNGLQLEEPTKELAEQVLSDGAVLVELGDRTLSPAEHKYDFSFPKEGGKPNPHLWTNPRLAGEYAAIVRDVMSERDPANADAYSANYEAFARLIDEFDEAMRTSFATIPAPQRKLLTYHDSFAYFAEDYGWEVIGAIQVADFGDPTAKEVGALIEQVRASGVPAIFGSEVFPSPVLEQIGREAGVRYVDALRDDDLPGAPGDAEHSWIGLLRFDFITMTEALGGDASALEQFVPSNVITDSAEYAA